MYCRMKYLKACYNIRSYSYFTIPQLKKRIAESWLFLKAGSPTRYHFLHVYVIIPC